jgi:hypothetical protein
MVKPNSRPSPPTNNRFVVYGRDTLRPFGYLPRIACLPPHHFELPKPLKKRLRSPQRIDLANSLIAYEQRANSNGKINI